MSKIRSLSLFCMFALFYLSIKMKYVWIILIVLGLIVTLKNIFSPKSQSSSTLNVSMMQEYNAKDSYLVLGGGCFWCVEAAYERLQGVEKVISGYAGGTVKNPSYEAVCAGTTGHAEVVKVIFNPEVISLEEILEVFWNVHNPTTPDRQGNDVGPQYRSIILYNSELQKQVAQKSIQTVAASFDKPIVTQVEPLGDFYTAENYHQDYYDNHKSQPYCYYTVRPKIKKIEKLYEDRLKTKYKK